MDKKFIKIMIIAMMIGIVLVMNITFFTAMYNESDSTTIYINKYNEMWIEAILMPIFLCLGVYLLYDEMKGVKNEKV